MQSIALPWLAALLLTCAVLASSSASTGRAAPVAFAIIACENLAPHLDGDSVDATTPADELAACGAAIAPVGEYSIASLALALGDRALPLTGEDLAALDPLDHNRLPPACTFDAVVIQQTVSAVGCVLVGIGFFDEDFPVRFSVSANLRLVETAGAEYICTSLDADCDQNESTQGDGVVASRILNHSGVNEETGFVHAVQESIGYPLTVSISEGMRFDTNAPFDADGDGVNDVDDNCPGVANATQTNTDQHLLVVGPGLPQDSTLPNDDGMGDACDLDDDNDGLSDAVEGALPSDDVLGCEAVTSPTDPLSRDSDGDRYADEAECNLDADPASALSTPPIPASDADRDGLDDVFEIGQNFSAIDPDTDDDNIADGIEFLFYWTAPLDADTDGDGCSDGVEIASLDANTVVNIIDLHIVAYGLMQPTPPPLLDVNRDGEHNSLDLFLVAANFSGISC